MGKKDIKAARVKQRDHLKLKKKNFKKKASSDGSAKLNNDFFGNEDYLSILEANEPTGVEHEKQEGKFASKKKRKGGKGSKVNVNDVDGAHKDADGLSKTTSAETTDIIGLKERSSSIAWKEGDNLAKLKKANPEKKAKHKMTKELAKCKKKSLDSSAREGLQDNINKIDAEKVDELSAVDEDCSRGMKKWLIEHKQSRPGLKILQQRIDEFIVAHEEQQEQARKEREALAAEGGWTVVKHHKGRKKTTDVESGVSVGSVAEAAIIMNMENKKTPDPPANFYRFQRREAKRNELMMLQNKFEQDRKRIQQLRAARKFRPY